MKHAETSSIRLLSEQAIHLYRAMELDAEQVLSPLREMLEVADGLNTLTRHAIARFARKQEKNLAEYRGHLREHLATLSTQLELWMRISSESLTSVLQEGRFSNMFGDDRYWPREGFKGSLVQAQEKRKQLELLSLGIPLDAPSTDRPCYGYCLDDPDGRPMLPLDLHPVYGRIAVRFRSSVRRRTTLSFWLKEPQMFVGADPMLRPTERIWPWFLADIDPLDYDSFDQFTPFLEAQIYGPLTIEHIEEVVLLPPWKEDTDLIRMMDAADISWRHVAYCTHFGRLKMQLARDFALGLDSRFGPSHWDAVEEVGSKLARVYGADELVVRLFALFHDSGRRSEQDDPGHGARAAKKVRAMYGETWGICRSDLRMDQLDLLCFACEHQEHSRASQHPTLRACWEADRVASLESSNLP